MLMARQTGPTPGTANANEASRKVWGRAFGALAAFQQPEDTKSVLNRVARAPSQGCGDIAGVVSAARNMWAGPYATTNGQSTTASDLRTVPPPAKPATGGDETLVGLIKGVLENLATQVPKFNAFSEVSKHVRTSSRDLCNVVPSGSYVPVAHSLCWTMLVAGERAERVQVRVPGRQDISYRREFYRASGIEFN